MLRRLILVLLVLLPSSALAQETCTAVTSPAPAMTAQATGSIWTGCTPSALDNYVVSNAASKVVISNGASAIAMASLTISAGTVVLSPEAKLSMTGPIRVNGTGTLIANHRILFSGRATDWTWSATNGSQTVTFAENVQANSDVAAGDFIDIGDDDPESLIGRITNPIKVGPGVAAPNEYRSSHAKWKRFRVTGAATGGVVPFEYDQLTGSLADSYTAGAYTGSRLPLIGVTPTVNTRRRHGFETLLTVPTGTVTGTAHGDLGDRWVEWTAGPCSGQVAKVTQTLDGAAGTDSIYVAGDATSCGLSAFDLTPGARAGDPVRIVRAPVIDFAHTANSFILWDTANATVRAHGLQILRPTYVTAGGGDWGGFVSDFCTFCLVNSTGSGTTTTGWLRSVEIAFPECNPNSDTSVIGIMGVDSSGAAPFGGKKLNASRIQLSRLYIHDQSNIGAGAVGCHGIFHRRPGYAKHERIRIERLIDDFFGSSFDDLGESYYGKTEWYQMITLGQLPSYNSSESHGDLKPIPTSGSATYDDYVGSRGQRVVGHFGFGGSARISDHALLGSLFTDIVVGGAYDPIGTSGGANVFFITSSTKPTNWPTPFHQSGVDVLTQYPNQVKNSLFFLHGDSSTPNVSVGGMLSDSIIVPGAQNIAGLAQATGATRVFWDLGALNQGFQHSTGTFVVAHEQRFTDFVMVGTAFNDLYHSAFDSTVAGEFVLDTLNWKRVQVAANTPTVGAGLSQSGLTNDTGRQVWTVDGLVVGALNPGNGGLGSAATGSGALVTRACVDAASAANATNAFGSAVTASSQNILGIGPHGDDDLNLRSYTDGNDACPAPRALGLSRITPSHAMLGDLFVNQLSNWATRDLFRTTRSTNEAPTVW